MKQTIRRVITVFLLVFLTALPAFAAAPPVTNVIASVSDPVDLGNNIEKFTFNGTITTNGPMPV